MSQRTPESPPLILPIPSDVVRPLWSVMIPTYNCISYIKEAIQSVLMQDPGEEIMQIEVVDDYSTDGNVEKLVNEVGNGRVLFFKQEVNRGSLRNFETCINRSRGYYVHILHGDDRVEPGFYKEIEASFERYPKAGAALTNFNYIDYQSIKIDIVNNRIVEEPGIIPDFLLKIAERQLIQPPAIVVKRSVYEALGSFYAVHFGEDWEMWARIASKYPIVYSPNYLASYRVSHGIGISYNYFHSGQNISDILKVINLIGNHLPPEKRVESRKKALAYYAIYCIRIANTLLSTNENSALKQVKGAWSMSKNATTLFWTVRFYLMYVLRYKKIEKKLLGKKK
jgi:glycosyltransferase involved in cell wall biosynthesis